MDKRRVSHVAVHTHTHTHTHTQYNLIEIKETVTSFINNANER